jgi:hypothetical protein
MAWTTHKEIRIIYKPFEFLYFFHLFKILNYLLTEDLGARLFRPTDESPRRDQLDNPRQDHSMTAVIQGLGDLT